jgi:hypothetical protein
MPGGTMQAAPWLPWRSPQAQNPLCGAALRCAMLCLLQPLSTAAAPEPSGEHPKSIAEALEYRPSLGPLEDALCLLAAAGLCAAVYCWTAPAAGFQLRYAASMALLYAVLLGAGRGWLVERKYQVYALERRLVGDLSGPGTQGWS